MNSIDFDNVPTVVYETLEVGLSAVAQVVREFPYIVALREHRVRNNNAYPDLPRVCFYDPMMSRADYDGLSVIRALKQFAEQPNVKPIAESGLSLNLATIVAAVNSPKRKNTELLGNVIGMGHFAAWTPSALTSDAMKRKIQYFMFFGYHDPKTNKIGFVVIPKENHPCAFFILDQNDPVKECAFELIKLTSEFLQPVSQKGCAVNIHGTIDGWQNQRQIGAVVYLLLHLVLHQQIDSSIYKGSANIGMDHDVLSFKEESSTTKVSWVTRPIRYKDGVFGKGNFANPKTSEEFDPLNPPRSEQMDMTPESNDPAESLESFTTTLDVGPDFNRHAEPTPAEKFISERRIKNALLQNELTTAYRYVAIRQLLLILFRLCPLYIGNRTLMRQHFSQIRSDWGTLNTANAEGQQLLTPQHDAATIFKLFNLCFSTTTPQEFLKTALENVIFQSRDRKIALYVYRGFESTEKRCEANYPYKGLVPTAQYLTSLYNIEDRHQPHLATLPCRVDLQESRKIAAQIKADQTLTTSADNDDPKRINFSHKLKPPVGNPSGDIAFTIKIKRKWMEDKTEKDVRAKVLAKFQQKYDQWVANDEHEDRKEALMEKTFGVNKFGERVDTKQELTRKPLIESIINLPFLPTQSFEPVLLDIDHGEFFDSAALAAEIRSAVEPVFTMPIGTVSTPSDYEGEYLSDGEVGVLNEEQRENIVSQIADLMVGVMKRQMRSLHERAGQSLMSKQAVADATTRTDDEDNGVHVDNT